MYMVRAGFPVEVARLIDWFRHGLEPVSQIMRSLPPLSITGEYVDQTIEFWEETGSMRGHLETIRRGGRYLMGIYHDYLEYRPSWGYLQ